MLGLFWIISRFQRLVDYPIDDFTEICFLKTDYSDEVPCSDIPDWLDPNGVATWDPVGANRHLCEWIVGTLIALGTFYVTYRNHNKSQEWRRHPLALPFIAAGIYHCSYYSWFWGMPERSWLLTPCHTGWMLRMIIHYVPMTDSMADALRHTMLCFSSLAALFIFQPDGEINEAFSGRFTWSLWHHLLLLYMPVHDLAVGNVCVLPPPSYRKTERYSDVKYFVKWHMVSIAVYLILYATICTPIALMSGANFGLTVFFHNTQMAEAIHLTGPNYRVFWFLYCNMFFVMVRLFLAIVDQLLRDLGISVFSEKNQAKMWNDFVASKYAALVSNENKKDTSLKKD